MATLLTILAAAEEAEPSKTAFYALGGALAVWAVVLGALGLQRAEFPGNAGGERAVIGVTALLMVGTVAAAVLSG